MSVCHGYANCCACPKCQNRQVRKLSSRKDVRAEARMLRNLGFDYVGLDSSGHPCFDHGNYGEIQLPNSPSSTHWRKILRARLARMMDMNLHQLERLLAGQPLHPSTRERGPGRASSEAVVMEYGQRIHVPVNKAQARALLTRYDGVRGAKNALSGMREAELLREA